MRPLLLLAGAAVVVAPAPQGEEAAVGRYLDAWRHRALVSSPRLHLPARRRRAQDSAGSCRPASKLWHVAPSAASAEAFLMGSVHHHYLDVWPFIPPTNLLALSTCDTLFTECVIIIVAACWHCMSPS